MPNHQIGVWLARSLAHRSGWLAGWQRLVGSHAGGLVRVRISGRARACIEGDRLLIEYDTQRHRLRIGGAGGRAVGAQAWLH